MAFLLGQDNVFYHFRKSLLKNFESVCLTKEFFTLKSDKTSHQYFLFYCCCCHFVSMVYYLRKILLAHSQCIQNSCLYKSFDKQINWHFTLKHFLCLMIMIGDFVINYWINHDPGVGWWKSWNFIVWQLKFNRFLHPNEHPLRIFWYLARLFDWEPAKIGHNFTK